MTNQLPHFLIQLIDWYDGLDESIFFFLVLQLHLTSSVSLFGHYGLEIQLIWWFKNWKTIFSHLRITQIKIHRIVGDSMTLIPCNTQNILLPRVLFQISFGYVVKETDTKTKVKQGKSKSYNYTQLNPPLYKWLIES